MAEDGARREEILATAATMFASAGMRTTLRDIGDACGILPGSLYHHFESKEAIIIELVRRCRDELDRLAKDALDSLHEPGQQPVEDRIVEFAEAIAACAIRNRAALLLTLYEPPSASGDELAELARQTPGAIDAAMLEILQAGRSAGVVRDGFDLALLAERICQSMFHMAVGAFHRSAAGRHLPKEKCRVYLHGVMAGRPRRSLDRSDALKVARAAVANWDLPSADSRRDHLLAVARTEFARRGFEATTVRDVAKASGVSTGTVYRTFNSKDELLLEIMETYAGLVASSWDEVINVSSSSPLERLDALLWVNANVVAHFSEEFKIQLAWLRQSPPNTVDLGVSLGQQLRQLQQLVDDGVAAGELQVEGRSAVARTRSLYELMLPPEHVVEVAGIDGTHELARETLLRGALVRR
jgi:AcrR family transcriptional regulator